MTLSRPLLTLLLTTLLTLLITLGLAAAAGAEDETRRSVLITVDDLPIVGSASLHSDPEERLRSRWRHRD